MLSQEELLQKSGYTPPAEKSDSPGIIGYRRVWNGGCDHCQLASERLYFRGDLAPIHNGCECGIVPVFKGEKHGLFTTRKKLDVLNDPKLGPRLDQSGDPGPPFVTADQLDEIFSGWHEGLDDELAGAFSQYKGNDAYRLNGSLRKADGEWDWLAKLLDKGLKTLDSDVRVYRGLKEEFQIMFGDSPRVGGIVHDKAFLSTTLSKQVAQKFSKQREGVGPLLVGEPGVLVEIVLPKGTSAAWLGKLDKEDDLLGKIGHEDELLVERDLDLEIVKVVNDHHIVVRARRPSA